MKFLVDANLPYNISSALNKKGYDSLHAKELPKGMMTTDLDILQIACDENRIIITRDYDFANFYLINENQFKLFIISGENKKNQALRNLLEINFPQIINLFDIYNFIELRENEILVHE
jgi:predicted nuclease of predicted toxin-antitoxin system